MKTLLKQKTTIAAMVSMILAIVCIVISSISIPENKLVSKMGNAIEKKNLKKYVSCFHADDQKSAEIDFSYYYMEEAFSEFGNMLGEESGEKKKTVSPKYNRILLQGEESENEDGSVTLPVKLLVLDGEEVISESAFDVEVYEQDGTEYIRGE